MLLLILVAIPLAFMGLGDYRTPQKDYSIIINDKVISVARLEQEVFQYKQALRKNYQGNIPSIYTDKFIRKVTLDYMTRSILLDDTSRNLGLKFHNKSIINEIKNTNAFKSEKGFTQEAYRNQLSRIGMTPKDYERYIFQKGISEQLKSAITDTSFLTQEEKDDLIKFRYHTREGEYILIPHQEIKKRIIVTDEELGRYFDKNTDDFMDVKKGIFYYIDVDKFVLINSIKINEEISRDIYNVKLANGEYFKPSVYKVNHILISADTKKEFSDLEESAAMAHKKLKEGASFSEIAKTFSNDQETRENRGYLGELLLSDLPAYLQIELKTLKIGEISKVIKSKRGFHIVSVMNKTEETQLSFEEAKKNIEKEYKTEEGSRLFFDLTDQISEKSFQDSSSLINIADEFNLKINTSKLISADEGYGIFNYQHIRKAIFDDDVIIQKYNSGLINVNNDRFIVARIKEYFPPTKLRFEKVKNAIQALLITQKTDKESLMEATKIKNIINDNSLEKINFERIDFSLSLNSDHVRNEIKKVIFSNNVSDKYKVIKIDSGDYLVYKINFIRFPEGTEKFLNQKNEYSNFISNTRSESEYNTFYDLMRSSANIKMNREYLELD